jgi:hypothetical protein
MTLEHRDIIYEDGFPDGWFMIHRSDTTLLCMKGDELFGSGITAIAAAPAARQGIAWLDTAKFISECMFNYINKNIAMIESEFCDNCGYGVSRDEHDKKLPNSRSVKTWVCLDCDHINRRPN